MAVVEEEEEAVAVDEEEIEAEQGGGREISRERKNLRRYSKKGNKR